MAKKVSEPKTMKAAAKKAVKPIARPTKFDYHWAIDRMAEGLKVKRAAWVGNKFLSQNHPRNVVSGEDMAADDWLIA